MDKFDVCVIGAGPAGMAAADFEFSGYVRGTGRGGLLQKPAADLALTLADSL